MKHKAGDTVRIRSKEWLDKQDKDIGGSIVRPMKSAVFSSGMSIYAGKTAEITRINNNCYKLDIDDGSWIWQDWMLEPDYCPDDPLSPEDAIRAMLDGETLYDEDGSEYWFSGADACFSTDSESKETPGDINYFHGLCRCPARRNRPMTQREAIDWARSKESWGWLVRRYGNDIWGEWRYPTEFDYSLLAVLKGYQRARLLPDNSGIDESTIQGFEIEVKE
jgi:hypothetical protein